MPGLKKWLLERKKLFQMRDSQDDEIVPKGILIMGIPGCGKSLSIKATASYFELPLYRVDMTAVFSGQHGTPDASIRRTPAKPWKTSHQRFFGSTKLKPA